jgi:hypothetical protein
VEGWEYSSFSLSISISSSASSSLLPEGVHCCSVTSFPLRKDEDLVERIKPLPSSVMSSLGKQRTFRSEGFSIGRPLLGFNIWCLPMNLKSAPAWLQKGWW